MQIAESFRRFGIAEASKHILAIKVGNDRSKIEKHLTQHVEGNMTPFADSELSKLRDDGRVRKVYKLDAAGKEAEAFVLGSMAIKGS